MKSLITLLFLSAQLFALSIVLNSGKESKTPYAILHIMDNEPFSCETIENGLEKERYLCKTKKPFTKLIEPKKMKYAEISFYEKENFFYIAIEPKIASKLIPVEDILFEAKEILKNPRASAYPHWTILLEETPLYREKPVHERLDFPVVFEKNQKPYVGALDLNGNPISYAQSKDIELYLDIKRAYERGDYEGVVKDAQKVLSAYPLSIFRSEIELYAIRGMDKVLSAKGEEKESLPFTEETIITLAKHWTKEFTSDENLPEVLMLMVKSYLAMGAKSDMNYSMDILVSEHPESPFTKRAILLFADSLFAKKEKDKAMKLYLDVLYSVKDLDIASEAAIRLSDHQMDAGKMQEAKEYLLKVLNVNMNYLLKNKESSAALARRLYEHKLYDVASRVQDLLVDNTPKSDESKELLLKQSGDWHAKAGDVEKAYARYQEYLSEYKHGAHVEDVKERLDELFFKRKENNETLLASHYDALIERYTNNAIGEKALVEKAKLLLKQGNYEALLALEESLMKSSNVQDVKPEELIYEGAKAWAIQGLQRAQCQNVVRLIETYKLHITESAHEEKLFECFVQLSRYERAKEMSVLHVKDAKLESRFLWSQRHANVAFKLSQYQEVDALKEDLQTLSKSVRKPLLLETSRTLFLTAIQLQKFDDALARLKSIEELYPNTFNTIDLHQSIVKLASERKDDLLLISHAQKMIALQKQFKSKVYSPTIEFTYIEALKRMGKDKEAYEVLVALENEPLAPKDTIRLLYNAGELSLKLKDETKAKAYFTKCVDVNETSSWKSICEENLKLF